MRWLTNQFCRFCFPSWATGPNCGIHEPRPYEISPGVPRPSYALALMMAQRMLVQPDKWVRKDLNKNKILHSQLEWTWADEKMSIVMVRTQAIEKGRVKREWTIEMNGKPFVFETPEEYELLLKTLNKCNRLNIQRAEAEAKFKREQEACNAIQSFFLVACEIESNPLDLAE